MSASIAATCWLALAANGGSPPLVSTDMNGPNRTFMTSVANGR
jgi:hypothetical protein